ncbi:16S rRNA (guanine(527)-N(7))-methyltransferase RsmG [Naumannella halotolerans]|uniref:Ribosomal RNA small subunit methyltransferase G n=1 Tax=Naumannella halotolerans TaxID=993414 RepID=A0A4R7J1L4_9ACTN|nr:16S rRNA (guanine(527)-N(7))-methyltransferase RsmG [Naumannella halotolerans]TDT31000.1 16S rRNA (guanine527-N7)-methyltransferase [Naumannella halotolerans]
MSVPIPPAAQDLFGDRIDTARAYVEVLADRGVSHGLLGPREIPRLWERHLINSLALEQFVETDSTVVDIGSGAGLPGIPLAIARPDLQVTLLEPLLRRSKFLTTVVDELGLSQRVSVVRARAEDHDGRYAVVTARAVAPLPRLVDWALPLMSEGGTILALKGASALAEVADAAQVVQRLALHSEVSQVVVHPDAEPTTVVSLRRNQ